MKHHPEQLPSQIYMGNEPKPNSEYSFRFTGGGIGWRTKTHGVTAYDTYGNHIEGMVPVFIEASEIKSAIEHKKLLLETNPQTAYGAEESIKVYQEMLDKRTVF